MVSYDKDRVNYGGEIPHHLFSLGDFIEKGVCNERGMLLQIALQYLGIRSELEKVELAGQRHAWVHAYPEAFDELLLDPQEGRPGEYDQVLAQLRDNATRFARERMGTSVGVPTDFFKAIKPIGDRLSRGEITPQEAAVEAWDFVRGQPDRDSLLFVALKKLGINSEVKKGLDGTSCMIATFADGSKLNMDFELRQPWEEIEFGRLRWSSFSRPL